MESLKFFLAEHVLWLKAAHVIAVISWMAGMLYLPRLFVYHTQTVPGAPDSERFKVMERKLLKGIINPAMGAAWLFGLALVWVTGAWMDGWFHAKFAAVLGMSGFHGFLSARSRDFAADRNTRSERFWRIANEVPAVLMVAIVILVVVKPF